METGNRKGSQECSVNRFISKTDTVYIDRAVTLEQVVRDTVHLRGSKRTVMRSRIVDDAAVRRQQSENNDLDIVDVSQAPEIQNSLKKRSLEFDTLAANFEFIAL